MRKEHVYMRHVDLSGQGIQVTWGQIALLTAPPEEVWVSVLALLMPRLSLDTPVVTWIIEICARQMLYISLLGRLGI